MTAQTLQPVHEFRFTAKPPYDFWKTFERETKFGADWFWLTPREVRTPAAVWSGFPFQGKSLGIRVTPSGSPRSPRLTALIFAKRRLSRPTLDRLRRTLAFGLDTARNLTAFYRLCRRYAFLRAAAQDLRGMRELPFIDAFHAVTFAITLQRTSPGRTIQMLINLADRFGDLLSFDGESVTLLPSPEVIARVDEASLLTCKLGYRAAFIRYNAQAAAGRAVDLQELAQQPKEEATAVLRRTFKGIGPYSGDVILPHPSFPIDTWNGPIFRRLCQLPIGTPDKQVARFAEEHFGAWRKYVQAYILNDLNRLE